jgi:hypothetical protein
MANLVSASAHEKLWHAMRRDLVTFAPEIAGSPVLMCCTCGRVLPHEWFDLEHLIPQQSLRRDPAKVRANPQTRANVRSGNLLLCKKPLKIKSTTVYANGCNSWKGRFYDKPISQLISGVAFERGACTQVHIIAALSLAYLTMVSEFGYVVSLLPSGLLMREQFFNPRSFHRRLPYWSQMILGGSMPDLQPEAKVWKNPFSFTISDGRCTVAARNFAVHVPLSRDPRLPMARHVRFVPDKYKLRPNFRMLFE